MFVSGFSKSNAPKKETGSVSSVSVTKPIATPTIKPTKIIEKRLSIGDIGVAKFSGDTTQIIILGIDKETTDLIGKSLLAKDMEGIYDLLVSGKAFPLGNGLNKVRIIDTEFGIRKVRVLEDNQEKNSIVKDSQVGKAGWLPKEWVVAN